MSEPVVTPQAEETTQTETQTEQQTTVETTQQEQTQTETQTEQTTQEQETEVPKFKIKRNGEDIELTQEQLLEEAQKGYDYTRKTQELAEVRKQQEWKINTFDQLAQNPAMMKLAMATQLGYDPSLVVANPTPPPQELAQADPVLYTRLQTNYENDMRNKQVIDQAVNAYISKTATENNVATLNLVAIENNLNDQQKSEVAQFVQNNLRAAGTGMYSKNQIEIAVTALYGKQKQQEKVLNTANQVRTNLKKIADTPPASNPKKQQPPPSDPRLADAQRLVKLAEETYGVNK